MLKLEQSQSKVMTIKALEDESPSYSTVKKWAARWRESMGHEWSGQCSR